MTQVSGGVIPLLPPEIIGGPEVPAAPGTSAAPAPQARLADSWVWPIRNHYTTVDFLDVKYHAGLYGADVQGFWHTGIDLNVGGTSGNGDAGKPVYACATGRVEYVAVRTAGGTWGPMVVLSHTLPGGKVRYTRYAHLGNVKVSIGQFVAKGQQIAEIGLPSVWGFPRMYAHLHFDVMHTRPFRLTHWPTRNAPQSEVTAIYQDADAFLRAMKAGEPA